MKGEKRFIPLSGDNIEIRENSDGKREIVMNIPYNSWSEDLGGFREKITPGFFDDSIAEGKIGSYWNHDTGKPMGNQANGALRFEPQKTHMRVIQTPPDTTWGRDAIIAADGGYIKGASFRFLVTEDRWNHDKAIEERELVKGNVFEFSPVSEPAYPKSRVQARSLLAGAGIDLDTIATAFEANSAGREIDADSQEAVRSAIGALNNLLPQTAEQEPGDVPIDDGQESIDFMEKRLELQA